MTGVLCWRPITCLRWIRYLSCFARFLGGRVALVMGKKSCFQINPFFQLVFPPRGVVPVHRGKGDTAVVDQAIECVRKGQGLLIFPEGTRSKDGNLGKLKRGVCCGGTGGRGYDSPAALFAKGGKMKLFGHCTVVFGKPIPPREKLTLRSRAALHVCVSANSF